jgi:hypothetical protein
MHRSMHKQHIHVCIYIYIPLRKYAWKLTRIHIYITKICTYTYIHSSSSSSYEYIATDGQSASSSWCRVPLWGSWPNFNFRCLIITFLSLHVGRPLWRKDEFVICSAITHWLESRRTHNHILLSHLRLTPTCRVRSPYLYPQEQGGPVTP